MTTNNSSGLGGGQGGPGAADFFEDRRAFGFPDVGLGIGIAAFEVGVDVGDQVTDRVEAARADHVGGEVGEEALDEVHPR